jgi:hypothetical protein
MLQNRWRKRGLAVTPTKFGIAFTKLTYNQGGALVHVYTDGTVGPEFHSRRHPATARVCAPQSSWHDVTMPSLLQHRIADGCDVRLAATLLSAGANRLPC